MILDIIATVLLVLQVFMMITYTCKKEVVSGADVAVMIYLLITHLLPIYCIWR